MVPWAHPSLHPNSHTAELMNDKRHTDTPTTLHCGRYEAVRTYVTTFTLNHLSFITVNVAYTTHHFLLLITAAAAADVDHVHLT